MLFRASKIKRNLKQLFEGHVSASMLKEILENSDKIRLDGERQTASLLFVSVQGADPLSIGRSPVKGIECLNEYVRVINKIILDNNGYVHAFTGDRIMACFGIPVFSKDYALRAAQAAILIKKALVRVRDQFKFISRTGISVRTGELVYGACGSGVHSAFSFTGTCVDMGNRLCSEAEDGEILICGATYKLLRRNVEVVQRQELQLKQDQDPVEAYSIMNFVYDLNKERRQYRRIEAEMLIRIKTGESDEGFKQVRVNISGGGFRIRSNDRYDGNPELDVEITLPNNIVVRNVIGKVLESSKRDTLWETRVRFEQIREEDRDEIIKYVYFKS